MVIVLAKKLSIRTVQDVNIINEPSVTHILSKDADGIQNVYYESSRWCVYSLRYSPVNHSSSHNKHML